MLSLGYVAEQFTYYFLFLGCFNYICSDICVCVAQVGNKKCTKLTDGFSNPDLDWGHDDCQSHALRLW